MVFMPPSHYHIVNQGGVYDVFLQCMQSSGVLGFIKILITYMNYNEFAHTGKLRFPTSTTKMALILHRIDLPIKMDSWAFRQQ
jgi:hypothetical protein